MFSVIPLIYTISLINWEKDTMLNAIIENELQKLLKNIFILLNRYVFNVKFSIRNILIVFVLRGTHFHYIFCWNLQHSIFSLFATSSFSIKVKILNILGLICSFIYKNLVWKLNDFLTIFWSILILIKAFLGISISTNDHDFSCCSYV